MRNVVQLCLAANTVNPILRPHGVYLFQALLRWGLIESGAYLIWKRQWRQFSIENLEYKVEKFRNKKLEVMQPKLRIRSEFPVCE